MQNAAQAYGAVANQIANPRELEANLLLRAASQMQAVYDGWDRKRSDLDLALRYNRKLWAIFLASVTSTEHALPVAIRQNVATLGLFVMNQTVTMLSIFAKRATVRPRKRKMRRRSANRPATVS